MSEIHPDKTVAVPKFTPLSEGWVAPKPFWPAWCRKAWRAFWRWLCRFAYRRCAEPIHRAPDGLPGIRDVNARCHGFEPRPRQAGDFRDCEGDGHYLCKECCHLKPEES